VQAWALFQRYATVLNLPETGRSTIEEPLKRMSKLTPGDFAAVARQARFCPIVDSETLLKALNNECTMKDGQSHTSMGFM
jgi:hypothetical protein